MRTADKFIKTEGNFALLTLFDGDDERTVRLPFKFCICGHCSGSGWSSAYLGAFTADEMNERDDQWREDYFAGRFDRPCEHCKEHPGRTVEPDYSRMSKRDRKLWNQQLADERADERTAEMERRMGA